MKQKRKHERIKRRMKVEYGDEDLRHTGLATDVSVGGIFLNARRIYELNDRLHLHIIDHNHDFYCEGVVVRVKKVDPRLRRIEQEGMGIRFLSPTEMVRAAIPLVKERNVETNTVVFDSREKLKSVLSQQLSAGVVMVPVGDPPPAAHQYVEIEFVIDFDGQEVEVHSEGRVVQILGSGKNLNAVVEVRGIAELRKRLEEFV